MRMNALSLKDASALAILADSLGLSDESARKLVDALETETAKRAAEALRSGVEPQDAETRAVVTALKHWAEQNRLKHGHTPR